MDQKIVRLLKGTATQSEIAAIHEWRAVSAENESRYRAITTIWAATGPDEPDFVANVPDARRIIAIGERWTRSDRAGRTPTGLRPAVLRAAAIATLIVGSLVATRILTGSVSTLAAVEITTGPNELVRTRLSDGTTVRLAPNSTLLVEDGGDRRQVRLDGRAFFAVAPNPASPFVVRTDAGEALVLGTRFQVDATPDDMRVLVVEGRVELGTSAGRVEVGTGQSSRAERGGLPYVETNPEIGSSLSWMDGFLAFQDTPLSEVASEMEIRYGISFPIPNQSIGERTVSASFVSEDVEDVLSVVCRVVGVGCLLEDSVVTVVE